MNKNEGQKSIAQLEDELKALRTQLVRCFLHSQDVLALDVLREIKSIEREIQSRELEPESGAV